MSKLLYQQPDVVSAEYDAATNAVIVTWQNLGPHNYLRPCLAAQNKSVKGDGAKYIIVDTSEAKGVLKQEDQEWFATELFPELQAAGLKAIITIVPKAALTKMATRQWTRTGAQFGIEFYDAASMEDAVAIVNQG